MGEDGATRNHPPASSTISGSPLHPPDTTRTVEIDMEEDSATRREASVSNGNNLDVVQQSSSGVVERYTSVAGTVSIVVSYGPVSN